MTQFYEAVFGHTLERLNSPDVEMWAFPMSIGQYGHIVLAVDTEGNMFGLHSMR